MILYSLDAWELILRWEEFLSILIKFVKKKEFLKKETSNKIVSHLLLVNVLKKSINCIEM